MKKREIPAVKGKPQYIPYVLRIINNNVGKYKSIEEKIHHFICSRKRNRNKPPSIDSSKNMTLTPLRLLLLIKGEVDDTRLTFRGEKILEASQTEIEKIAMYKFRKAFAPHLLELEKRYYIPVIEEAKEIIEIKKSSTFSVDELLQHLANKYGKEGVKKDRLQVWLRYLRFAGFISKNEKTYSINNYQVKAAQIKPSKINVKKFRKELVNAYEPLSKKTRSRYVPIPDLRESVLRSFNGRLWDEDFNTFLTNMKKEDSKYVISFAEPMYPKINGFRFNGDYYYYIIIRDKVKK